MDRRTFLQVAGVGSTLAALSATAQAQSRRGTLATAAKGQAAFEFLGRSDQDGPTVTHYGYLTHIANLSDEVLFSDPNLRTEATALFTFFAATTLDARHELGNLISTSAPGELNIFLNETGGADFDAPSSFAQGIAIATFSARYHNVLNVQAPNQGIATAAVELRQLRSDPLTDGLEQTRFGRPGLRLRLLANGQGTRTQPDPVQAFFLVGGNAIVAD